ncbi:MAG: tRNA-dihydrouridine synthase family protein, partial [Bdellovibrionota bacterium]
MNRVDSQSQKSHIRHGVSALVLAPMEGIVDATMREVLTQSGAYSFCVSEFLRVSRNPHSAKSIRSHIPELTDRGCATPSGTPVQLQLLGGEPECLAATALRAAQIGVTSIDLNFGCPAKTVNRNDGGATLLKYPHRIKEIVRSVREAVPSEIPVSAKLRLGWESMDSIFQNAQMAQDGGASWVTIHARTKEQGYRPPAHWKILGEVKSQLKIPVVANGEIWT